MNKAELIDAVTKWGKYSTKAEAARAYNAVVWAMSNRLSKGNANERLIRLPELGTFRMKVRKARKGRNPRSGKTIHIPKKSVVTFRAGKCLLESL